MKRPAIFSELEQYAAAHPQPRANHESPHTTHYSVVDAEGNAVAVTTTINDWFGSRVTADGLGFLLNDEMDDFSAKPGVPNCDGLIQGAANAIGPGKRPLSSMTPTIVVHDGKVFLVLGSPGSSKIITTVANVLMGVVDYGMNIQEAVNAPRFHHQWLPDVLNVERWFSPDTVQASAEDGIPRRSVARRRQCFSVLERCGVHRDRPEDRRAAGRQRWQEQRKAVGY